MTIHNGKVVPEWAGTAMVRDVPASGDDPADDEVVLGAHLAGLVTGDGIASIVALDQAAYDALDPADPTALYVIVED